MKHHTIVKWEKDSSLLSKRLEEHLGYIPPFYTFSEMYQDFKRKAKKTKTQDFGTEEYFSLGYNTLLSDLKKSVWIMCDEDLSKHFKVLETCE